MDVDEIPCKFGRSGNGGGRLGAVGLDMMDGQFRDEEEDGENSGKGCGTGRGVDLGSAVGRFYNWPSSRIVRVSRASGGKDRHSKVLTSKGLRDRRVRLSVNTAIQFYDLQDRLGYDQPSKAVEWLLKAAASSISELPPMSSPFPDTPKQLSDEKRSSTGGSDQLGFDSAEVEMDGGGGGDASFSQQVSSTSETSKCSGLSLSRSESRIKARERAKERVAEKEKESLNMNSISQTTSFTELLNGGINADGSSPNNSSVHQNPNESNFFMKSPKHWSSDYFTTGLLAPLSSVRSGQSQLGANNHFYPVASPLFGIGAPDHQSEFSFVPDHLAQVVNNSSNIGNHENGSSEYNLSFSIASAANSSGLPGFNRGTLQSNSSPQSLLPHIQRFTDGSSPSFLIGAAAGVDNHQQFLTGYDARLQLCYGDSYGNNGHKGRGKN